MREQDRFKNILEKMIKETENHKIKSSQELIQALIYELTSGHMIIEKSGNTETELVN